MSFESDLGRFLKWFHFLGQNTHSSSIAAPRANSLKYIPVGIRFLVAFFAFIVLCVHWKRFGEFALLSSFSKIANVQLSILLILDLVTAFIVASQALFLPSLYSKLYAQIHVIEQLSRKKFFWDLKVLRRTVVRRMCYMCVAFSLPYIAIASTKPITSTFLAIMCSDVALALTALITHFHALFYIQLLNHMLQSLVSYIEAQATAMPTTNVTTNIARDRDSNATMEKLELYYFKLLHFNLWEFTQIINQLFGWILFVYLLDHFLYTIYIFFQTCIILLNPSNFIEIIRELNQKNHLSRVISISHGLQVRLLTT